MCVDSSARCKDDRPEYYTYLVSHLTQVLPSKARLIVTHLKQTKERDHVDGSETICVRVVS